MEQRVSLITLGVRDLEKARRFYNSLDWMELETPDGVVAFDLLSQTLGLYPIEKLAEEIGVPVQRLAQGAMTLSYNARTKEEVRTILDLAASAGAEILKPADEVFWGGYHGYFSDLDGHIWEVAYNPFSRLASNGAFCWNGY